MISDVPQSATRLRRHRRISMRRLLCVASAIVFTSACNDGGRSFRPTSPSSSTPTSPSAAARYTLSGVVFEMTTAGRTPIQGVSVYCDLCGGPLGHTFADTDANGFYSLPGTANGYTPLIVRKEGYGFAGSRLDSPMDGWITATVNGDTTFDIEVVRR